MFKLEPIVHRVLKAARRSNFISRKQSFESAVYSGSQSVSDLLTKGRYKAARAAKNLPQYTGPTC